MLIKRKKGTRLLDQNITSDSDVSSAKRVVCWDTIHELGIDYGVSFNKDNVI